MDLCGQVKVSECIWTLGGSAQRHDCLLACRPRLGVMVVPLAALHATDDTEPVLQGECLGQSCASKRCTLTRCVRNGLTCRGRRDACDPHQAAAGEAMHGRCNAAAWSPLSVCQQHCMPSRPCWSSGTCSRAANMCRRRCACTLHVLLQGETWPAVLRGHELDPMTAQQDQQRLLLERFQREVCVPARVFANAFVTHKQYHCCVLISTRPRPCV